MEKYSAYRDPGTGVQLASPFTWLVGTFRTALLFVILALHLLLVDGVSLIFIPIPVLHRFITRIFTFLTARLALFSLGILWVSVDNVTRKRGRGAKDIETWHPRAGDIIVSNWVSYVEILWLAFRYACESTMHCKSVPTPDASTQEAITHTPGRRTGTGSANVTATTARVATTRVPIVGFRQVSLLSAICSVGTTPDASGRWQSLEEIRSNARRPVVVFPECTTSNGRALLHFANVFKQKVPVRGYNVFVMCVRYDPPTGFAATLAHTIPTPLNPLAHIFTVAASLAPQAVSIRLLAPSESPSSQLFLASEVLTGSNDQDPLADACASLISQIGKMKRTGMGWEDKVSFLDLFHSKKKR
ncbi:hypothetical protein FB45DRAFT_1133029 [Roridomyces roridus]|uniref:Phospholipid/glycerol acyltransferase domain-containing protein n=1 Tax=Roridomyces roridus TaxID=1738132 RepID=A0AAD7C4I8_9AGAR|nr:hypothetical protein FB45DRAFT_1133029 [Roridomyces roridus]